MEFARVFELLRCHVPELAAGPQLFCLMALVSAGALSSYVPPPHSLIDAYAEEPELGVRTRAPEAMA